MMSGVALLLSLWINGHHCKSYIEYLRFNNFYDGSLSTSPGLILHICSDGEYWLKNDDSNFQSGFLKKGKSQSLRKRILVEFEKHQKDELKDEKVSFINLKSPKSTYPSMHGNYSCLRVIGTGKERLLISPGTPKQGLFKKFLKLETALRKKKAKIVQKKFEIKVPFIYAQMSNVASKKN